MIVIRKMAGLRLKATEIHRVPQVAPWVMDIQLRDTSICRLPPSPARPAQKHHRQMDIQRPPMAGRDLLGFGQRRDRVSCRIPDAHNEWMECMENRRGL